MVSYFSEHAPSTEKINPSRDNLHESQRVDQTFKQKTWPNYELFQAIYGLSNRVIKGCQQVPVVKGNKGFLNKLSRSFRARAKYHRRRCRRNIEEYEGSLLPKGHQ